MALIDKIGIGLSAFGEGMQGRGPQYLQQLDERRKQAMVQDAYAVNQDLKAGNIHRARERTLSRYQNIERLGGDPSDTKTVLDLINRAVEGDEEALAEATRETDTFLEAAYQNGYIKRPPATAASKLDPTKVKSSEVLAGGRLVLKVLNNGETVYDIPDEEELKKLNEAEKKHIQYKEDIAVTTTRGRERTKDEEDRRQERVTEGTRFAKTLPTLRRAIDLLDSVETGNIDAAKLKAKQWFGIAEADEAELIYSLAQNVLKQLRPTFGSQFTASEGQWLEAIEAGISRSTKANQRLLRKALFEAQAHATTASKDALDQSTREQLESYLFGEHDITDEVLEQIYETRLQKEARKKAANSGTKLSGPPTGSMVPRTTPTVGGGQPSVFDAADAILGGP